MKPISGVIPTPPHAQVDLRDCAVTIRESVTMEEALSVYFPTLPRHGNRCPCPIHKGRDYNFSFGAHGYKCFVCGATGDIISFVKAVFDLPSMGDAMRRIDTDFRLNLFNGAGMSAEMQTRRREADERQKEQARREAEYNRLLDEWVRLDIAKRTADPASDEYAEAVKKIDGISYELDCAAIRLKQ